MLKLITHQTVISHLNPKPKGLPVNTDPVCMCACTSPSVQHSASPVIQEQQAARACADFKSIEEGEVLAAPLGHPREQCCRRRVAVMTVVTAVVDVVKRHRQQQPLGPLGCWQQGSGVVQGRVPVSLPLVR